MERLLAVGVGCAVGCASLALLSPGEKDRRGAGWHVRRVARHVRATLRRLGATAWAALALEWRPVRSLVDELAGRESLRSLGLSPRELAAALGVALLGASVLLALLLSSPVAGLVGAGVALAAVSARDSAARRRRQREVRSAMPGVYRTLSVALGSGQTLAQAVAYVGAHERGPAAAVFSRMSLRLRCGVGTEEAVSLLARELEVPGVDLLAAALVISHRTGSPLRELLTRSARLAERQGEFERLLQVKTAQVRLSVRIVCLLPAVMIAVLALVSPDFQDGLLTPVGLGCVGAALALDGVALLIIRRLVREVL